jgi:aryl-alcohol dehydrogenase-like predicted oxidoreductase
MTAFYGSFDRSAQEPESLRTIAKALELGINMLDTAWIYQVIFCYHLTDFNYMLAKSFGAGGGDNVTNEELVGKAVAIHGRDKFVIATKFGYYKGEDGVLRVSGKEDIIRSQLADSLRRLGTSYIDLYYMHRMDPDTPIEETMLVLKSLVQEGKIRYIGLSECTPAELRRAHAVHPITAIQMEWSLQTRDLEKDIVPCARELGVGIVAYSPLGRGFLTSPVALEELDESDSRRTHPRFSEANIAENKRRLAAFFELAERKGCTPAQLALSWVQSRGCDVFPIPGTKSVSRLIENAEALTVCESLSNEDLQLIDSTVQPLVGDRYQAAQMSRVFNARL